VTANIEKLRLTEGEFKVVGVYGGEQKFKQAEKLSRGADVIVATPGRLIDFANNGVIDFSSLKVACLDEAD
jgi:ATP-dependent RNA helicase DeaD